MYLRNTHWINNFGTIGGGALGFVFSLLVNEGGNVFINNSAGEGGVAWAENSTLFLAGDEVYSGNSAANTSEPNYWIDPSAVLFYPNQSAPLHAFGKIQLDPSRMWTPLSIVQLFNAMEPCRPRLGRFLRQ